MKKIANGNENPNQWKIQATCTGKGWNQNHKVPCNALFELNQSDIYFRTYTDYGGGTDTYYGFICPDCGCFTELNSNDLPSYIKSSAKSYKLYENAKYND